MCDSVRLLYLLILYFDRKDHTPLQGYMQRPERQLMLKPRNAKITAQQEPGRLISRSTPAGPLASTEQTRRGARGGLCGRKSADSILKIT